MSRVSQIEALFNPLQPVRNAIDPLGKLGDLDMHMRQFPFDRADAMLDLAHVVPQRIDRSANVAEMLKNDVVRLNHDGKVPQHRIIVNWGHGFMFFPKVNVKDDPVRRWDRPDRHFFANGACQVLAFAFLERYPDLYFRARWIKPAAGFPGNHIYVTDGANAFDYHGLTTEQRLLAFDFKRARRFFPGWDAALVDVPTDVLISEQRSRQIEGLWLREPKQFLYNALPRARSFLDRFGDIRSQLTASASYTSCDAG